MKSLWIAAVAALTVIVLTASLGVWQLRRADQKADAQVVRDAALATPPLRVGADPLAPAFVDGRRVEVVGRFDPAGTLLLDNRTYGGVAGFHVLTPLRVEPGGPQLMVLRGWVARDVRDRTRALDYATPNGTVRVEGLALAELPQPIVLGRDEGAFAPGSKIVQRFDLDAWRRARAPQAAAFVVRQTSMLDDGLVRDWIQPGTGVDRHRGYAAQWFGLSALTAVMTVGAAVRARRRRRDNAA